MSHLLWQVLIGLYQKTLGELATLPATAAYRSATEALTQSRLTIAQAVGTMLRMDSA